MFLRLPPPPPVLLFTHPPHSLTHPLTHSLARSLTRSLTLTHSLTHSLSLTLTHSHSPALTLTHPLTHSLTLTHPLTHSLTLLRGRHGTMCTAKGSDVRPGVPPVSLGLRCFCVAGVGQCALPRGRMYALASLRCPLRSAAFAGLLKGGGLLLQQGRGDFFKGGASVKGGFFFNGGK